jgi:hypothetical protein
MAETVLDPIDSAGMAIETDSHRQGNAEDR